MSKLLDTHDYMRAFNMASEVTDKFQNSKADLLNVVAVYNTFKGKNDYLLGKGMVEQLKKFADDYKQLRKMVSFINQPSTEKDSQDFYRLVAKASTMFYLLTFIEYEFDRQGYSDILFKKQQYQLPNFSKNKASNAA